MTLPTLTLTPQTDGFPTAGGALRLLLRVQAPPAPPERVTRPPLHLALVLDRSGSMSGAPLEEAKRCAQRIVERLTGRDRAAVIAFDNTVQTLVGLRPVEEAGAFEQALASLESGGTTALHAGWLQGANELAPHAESGALSRVVLLSDGQANVGLQDSAAIAGQCAQLAGAGVSTSTIGLGGSFNEELMVAMARQGQGQSYYGQSAGDLFDAFAEELDLAEALHSRDLRVHLTAGPGVIVRVVSQEESSAAGAIRLSDLAYGAESWLLVELHVGAKAAGTHALVSVVLSGTLRAGSPFTLAPVVLEVAALPAASVAALPADPVVLRRGVESEAALDFLSFRRHLSAGDRAGAERALERARARDVEHGWVASSVSEMERLLLSSESLASKEALYAAHRMQSRLASPVESAFCGDETQALASEMPRFLRRKESQGRGGGGA